MMNLIPVEFSLTKREEFLLYACCNVCFVDCCGCFHVEVSRSTMEDQINVEVDLAHHY